jgi:hypothetical protein
MPGGTVSYSVGNEHNPGNPWGRSELVITPDGRARLDHFFSRQPGGCAWTGQVDEAALAALWAALDRAGFPEVPAFRPVADATLRALTVRIGNTERTALVDWHQTPSLPGYAEAFDVLDGVIRQLSGGSVPYPSAQPPIVRDVSARLFVTQHHRCDVAHCRFSCIMAV